MHLVLLLFILPYFAAQFIGPADIVIERMDKCYDSLLGSYYNISMSKFNRTHLGMDIFAYLPFDFDETVAFNTTTSKWGDGGWKPNFFDIYDSNACGIVEKYSPNQFKRILKAFNRPETCPIGKGYYALQKYPISPELKAPIFYGNFMVETTLIKDNIPFACLRMFATTKPKRFF